MNFLSSSGIKFNAMNKLLITLSLVFASVMGFAQYQNPYPRTITVSGSSELEIVPDEIYVQVDLREYEKKGQNKVTIDRIRQEFLKSARSLGIPDSAISISAYDGSNGNPWLRKKKKKEELMASITYQVKLASSQQMDALVNVLDDDATQNFAIIKTSHSRIEQIKKQLKIEAVKTAKEKAIYLAAAVGEEVSVAVTINEPGETFLPYYNMRANVMMKEENAVDEAQSIDFKKIRYKYEVSVVFALK
jgi:uncharacterized protein YggE